MLIDRILKIIELEGINKSQFYKKTGLSNGFLDKVKDIGASKIEDILKSFPNINPEWLITGKGEMLRTCEPVKEESNIETELLKDKTRIIELLEDENERLKTELKQIKSNKSESIKTPRDIY